MSIVEGIRDAKLWAVTFEDVPKGVLTPEQRRLPVRLRFLEREPGPYGWRLVSPVRDTPPPDRLYVDNHVNGRTCEVRVHPPFGQRGLWGTYAFTLHDAGDEVATYVYDCRVADDVADALSEQHWREEAVMRREARMVACPNCSHRFDPR